MVQKSTTIKLSKETKERLDSLKEHPRETYEDILKKTLWVLNTVRKDPEKAKEALDQIDELKKRWLKKKSKEETKDSPK